MKLKARWRPILLCISIGPGTVIVMRHDKLQFCYIKTKKMRKKAFKAFAISVITLWNFYIMLILPDD